MSPVTSVFAIGSLAMLSVACTSPYESLAAQRMREICAADPNICENGVIVAKRLPQPGIQLPLSVLRVQRFHCDDGSGGQGTDLRVTAHVINVGTASFTSTQPISLTATLSNDGHSAAKSMPGGILAGVVGALAN